MVIGTIFLSEGLRKMQERWGVFHFTAKHNAVLYVVRLCYDNNIIVCCLFPNFSMFFATFRVEAGAVISSHVPHVRDRCWAHPGTWKARLSLPGS